MSVLPLLHEKPSGGVATSIPAVTPSRGKLFSSRSLVRCISYRSRAEAIAASPQIPIFSECDYPWPRKILFAL